ncbi:hypothetical protein G9A89_004495 [Geosiphon pyriformis]|nr:hypothetical protein G9A89_004495 [Geosiphon pyriformis]
MSLKKSGSLHGIKKQREISGIVSKSWKSQTPSIKKQYKKLSHEASTSFNEFIRYNNHFQFVKADPGSNKTVKTKTSSQDSFKFTWLECSDLVSNSVKAEYMSDISELSISQASSIPDHPIITDANEFELENRAVLLESIINSWFPELRIYYKTNSLQERIAILEAKCAILFNHNL